MIKFQLQCPAQHQFEGWFKSGGEFDDQQANGLISCPVCSDCDVKKAIMSPAIARHLQQTRVMEKQAADAPTADLPAKQEAKPQPPMTAPKPDPETAARMMVAMRHIKTYVEKNFENVGDQFAKEVRKIHDGEAEEREIYGKAKLEEARELIEDGIDILPLPEVPDLDS